MKDEDAVQALCQYYSRALMYEFTLNDRDDEFINKISEVRSQSTLSFFSN